MFERPPMPAQFGALAAWEDFAAGRLPELNFEPDDPECGLFRRRLVRLGPYVPVAIYRHKSKLFAWVDDENWKIDGDPYFFASASSERRFLDSHELRIEVLAKGITRHWRIQTKAALNMAEMIGGSDNDQTGTGRPPGE
jgi:hypothetical protein